MVPNNIAEAIPTLHQYQQPGIGPEIIPGIFLPYCSTNTMVNVCIMPGKNQPLSHYQESGVRTRLV
jgi:hypothetical protein